MNLKWILLFLFVIALYNAEGKHVYDWDGDEIYNGMILTASRFIPVGNSPYLFPTQTITDDMSFIRKVNGRIQVRTKDGWMP